MRRVMWNAVVGCVAILALVVSPTALAAKKKTPTPAAEASSASTASDGKSKTEKVNLNTADEKSIAGAKGVGAKLAKELVKSRPYKTWDDVSKVKGVGSGKKLDALKKILKLTEGVAASDDKAAKDDKKDKKTKSSSKGEEAVAPSGAAATTGKASATSESSTSKKSSSSSSEKAAAPKLAPGEKININTASAEELDKLPEIGPVKAKAIVDYRSANGKFSAIEDVMKVSGIKEGTFAKIKDYIVVR